MSTPELFNLIATRIIQEQERIIGPLAWTEAEKVSGIVIQNDSAVIAGDGHKIIDQLIARYERLLGSIAVDACRTAATPFLPEIPVGLVPNYLA